MPSIRELFADPELDTEDGGADIDIDKVLNSVTDVLNDRPARPGGTPPVTTDDGEGTPVTSEPSGPAAESEEEEEEEETGGGGPPAASVSPPPTTDPFLVLPAERRAALLALDEAVMADPAKRAAVFGILSGQAPTAAPAAPEPPKLPDDIDPDSFEAKLWRDQQENRQLLEKVVQSNRDQQIAFATQQANTVAVQAATRFGQRYQDRLTQADVEAIAKYTGQSGIAAAFSATPDGKLDPVGALDRALESVLWTNESFRAKVIDAAVPHVAPGEKPEAKARKRKLNAISPSGSPVSGPAPGKTPAEVTRDGRFTEKSRSALVKEIANGIARDRSGSL